MARCSLSLFLLPASCGFFQGYADPRPPAHTCPPSSHRCPPPRCDHYYYYPAAAAATTAATTTAPAAATTLQVLDSKAYVDGIKEGLPPIKLPKFMFRTGGCFTFFEAKLKPFLQFDDLKPEVFQIFREIGNMVAFTTMLSDAIDRATAEQYMQAAPLLGAVPGAEPPHPEASPWAGAVGSFMDRVAKDPEQVGSFMDHFACTHTHTETHTYTHS